MDRVVEQDRIHRILRIDRRNCVFIGGCAFAVFDEPVLPRVDDFDVSGNKILGKMYYGIHARAHSMQIEFVLSITGSISRYLLEAEKWHCIPKRVYNLKNS